MRTLHGKIRKYMRYMMKCCKKKKKKKIFIYTLKDMS